MKIALDRQGLRDRSFQKYSLFMFLTYLFPRCVFYEIAKCDSVFFAFDRMKNILEHKKIPDQNRSYEEIDSLSCMLIDELVLKVEPQNRYWCLKVPILGNRLLGSNRRIAAWDPLFWWDPPSQLPAPGRIAESLSWTLYTADEPRQTGLPDSQIQS